MTFHEYVSNSEFSAVYPKSIAKAWDVQVKSRAYNILVSSYLFNGLVGELEELEDAETVSEVLGDGEKMISELGGCLWYLAAIIRELNNIYHYDLLRELPDFFSEVQATGFHPAVNSPNNRWKKIIRGDNISAKDTLMALCQNTLSWASSTYGPERLREAAEYNLNQLRERLGEGLIQGSGDSLEERRGSK